MKPFSYSAHFATRPIDSYGNRIPLVVSELVRKLEDMKAEEVEGIFRLSGAATTVQNLVNELDRGPVRDYTPYNAITVACALKTYFREHAKTEPLLSFSLYPQFLQAVSDDNDDLCVARLGEVIKGLSEGRYRTLAYVILFLSRIAKNADKNKMNAMNLSICFAPNLIGGRDQSQAMIMMNNQAENRVIQLMIEHADTLFGHVTFTGDCFVASRETSALILSAANEAQLMQMNRRWSYRTRSLVPYVPKMWFDDPSFQRPTRDPGV